MMEWHTVKCEIVESFNDYVPPVPVGAIVRDLLRCVKPGYIGGLASVVITNGAALSRKERRRSTRSQHHKVMLSERRGYYQPASHDSEAAIQLRADLIIPRKWAESPNCLADPLLYRLVFALVLYHEIGHHIHFTNKPEKGEIERIANKHMYQLVRRMLFKRWYLIPLALVGMIPALIRQVWRPRTD